MAFLTDFFEFFRFIKHARERAAVERRAEREHQHQMLDLIFSRVAEGQKSAMEGIVALADAQKAQADIMKQWLEGFRITDPSPTLPQVVRPEEEWMREQIRLGAMLGSDAVLPELPPEFQLAYELAQMNQDSLGDFDREGSDFP